MVFAVMPHGEEGIHPPDGARGVPALGEPRYSQSLARGLAVLGCFTPQRPVLGISDIADELEMAPSTTHRYAVTLVALGYLEQGVRHKYRLALRVTDLGLSVLNASGLREHAKRHMEELCTRSSYTVSLAVLDGLDVFYVDRARSFRRGQSEIDLEIRRGSRLPAHCTSMGKLLLASLPKREQRRVIGEMTLERRGPNSITTKKALRRELEQIREAGFALNDQELAAGLHSIAAPVLSESREVVAAISMAAHVSMITLEGLIDELRPHLITTADRISECLGYRREHESASRREPGSTGLAARSSMSK